MKLIVVKFEDSVDTGKLPNGTVVTVSDGTNTLNDGVVVTHIEQMEHTHHASASVTVGPSVP